MMKTLSTIFLIFSIILTILYYQFPEMNHKLVLVALVIVPILGVLTTLKFKWVSSWGVPTKMLMLLAYGIVLIAGSFFAFLTLVIPIVGK